MKKILVTLLVLMNASMLSASEDLTLNGERWIGVFTQYVCQDGNTPAAVDPSELESFNVQFGHIGSTFSLDEFLIKATFDENGEQCFYSVILEGDKTAWTVAYRESRAYSNSGVSCEEGKAKLDRLLEFNRYVYFHGRAALFFPSVDSATACNGGADVGIHFQVRGRVQ